MKTDLNRHPEHWERTIRLKDGRRLGYDEHGALHGTPVFLMHGGTSSRILARNVAADAAELDIRVIAPDRPGIGLSDSKPGRTILDWPADVTELADSLGVERYRVVGVSEGTPFALACGLTTSERVSAVVVAGAIAPPGTPGVTLGWHGPVQVIFTLARHAPWLLRLIFAALMADVRLRGVRAIEASARMFPEADRSIFGQCAQVELRMADLVETFRQGTRGPVQDLRLAAQPWGFRLEDLSLEVRIWQGEHDVIHPSAMSRHLAARIPNANLTVVTDAGSLWTVTGLRPVLEALIR